MDITAGPGSCVAVVASGASGAVSIFRRIPLMIIIRETFVTKPGMASKLARQFADVMKGSPDRVRVLTDFIGTFNTVVIETEVENLAAFEKRLQDYQSNGELRAKMAGYTDLYIEGRREIFQVIS